MTQVPPKPVALEFRSENWPGGVVVSPAIAFAWNRFRRPDTLKVTACWMIVGVVWVPVGGIDCELLVALSTMIRVPPYWGSPRVTAATSLWAVDGGGSVRPTVV